MYDNDTDELDYEADLDFNVNALDVEWYLQPARFMKYAKAASDAVAEAKRAHEKVKVVKSILLKEAAEKLEKSNADSREAYYRTHKDHLVAKEEQIAAEHKADVLTDAKDAMRMVRDSLSNEVTLHGQSYFAGPSVPRNIDAEMAKESMDKTSKRRHNAGVKKASQKSSVKKKSKTKLKRVK